MKKTKYIIFFLLIVSIQQIVNAQEKPNIVLLFADDAGYADFGFQGSQVMKTPHLDQLATEGLKFTQGYVSASVNLPLSGTKSNHLEGGIRVPFLMRWPGEIPANIEYDYPISTLDLLPTFFKAGGGNTDSLKAVDGVNLLPFLKGENQERPHQTLYWKKELRGAIRDGDWKLIRSTVMAGMDE